MKLFFIGVLVVLFNVSARAEISCNVEEIRSGRFFVSAHFQVPVSSVTVWQVLTDYDHIADFVHSLDKSKIVKKKDNHIEVHQEGSVGFMFFKSRPQIHLLVEEKPFESISFRDAALKDFNLYEGLWQLKSLENGTEVRYQLETEKGGIANFFVFRGMVQKQILSMLTDLQTEMLRRKK